MESLVEAVDALMERYRGEVVMTPAEVIKTMQSHPRVVEALHGPRTQIFAFGAYGKVPMKERRNYVVVNVRDNSVTHVPNSSMQFMSTVRLTKEALAKYLRKL